MNVNFPFNDVKADVYIGTGAGKMIMEHIHAAKSRIVIVSPYVHSDYLDLLAEKQKSGVYVSVTTCYDEELKKARRFGKKKSIAGQFDRFREVDPDKKRKLFRLRSLKYAILFCLVLTALIGLHPGAGIKKIFDLHNVGIISALLIEIMLFLILHFLTREFNIFEYKYEKKYRFRLFLNPHKYKKLQLLFIHSKIYLIDDVVFLGSLNFTKAGFNDNMETRFKIEDSRFTRYVVSLIDEIYKLRIFANEAEIIETFFNKEKN